MRGIQNDVQIVAPNIVEGPRIKGESPDAYVIRLSRDKAEAARSEGLNQPLIAADTTVVLGDQIFGKPTSPSQAHYILKQLKGKTHRVVTGLTVHGAPGYEMISMATSTDVRLRTYTDLDIITYVNSGIPFDRAGSYGIQDRPFAPVADIKGCYLNVIGLPLCSVLSLMKEISVVLDLQTEQRIPYRDRCHPCKLTCSEVQE